MKRRRREHRKLLLICVPFCSSDATRACGFRAKARRMFSRSEGETPFFSRMRCEAFVRQRMRRERGQHRAVFARLPGRPRTGRSCTRSRMRRGRCPSAAAPPARWHPPASGNRAGRFSPGRRDSARGQNPRRYTRPPPPPRRNRTADGRIRRCA